MGPDHDITLPGGFVSALAAANTEHQILDAAARWIPSILDADLCTVALAIDATQLQIYLLRDASFVKGNLYDMDDSMLRDAYRTGRSVRAPSFEGMATGEAERLRNEGFASGLACPLMSGNEAVGTLNLLSETPNFFTPQHEARLWLVADLIAAFLRVHQLADRERQRARTDSLTESLNRRAILEELDHALTGDDALPSLLFLDVDGFKLMNDEHGHLHGDQLLRVLARRITAAVGEDSVLGRLGGDEFLVVVRDDRGGSKARAAARAITASCAQPIVLQSGQTRLRVSIGIASATSPDISPDELLHNADLAMYRAKRQTRT